MDIQQKLLAVTEAFTPFANYNVLRPKIKFNVVKGEIGSDIFIEFNAIDVEGMESIGKFIRQYYRPNNIQRFFHLSPKFGLSQNGYCSLILREKDIETIFAK